MPEFSPVTTLRELEALDDAEVLAGYVAGFRGAPEPVSSAVSRSYWHGWRNGRVDGGHAAVDAAQLLLAHLANPSHRLH